MVHYKDSDGFERWREYDSAGNMVHFKDSYGYERWREYDAAGNVVHFRNSDGLEEWCEYDGYYRAIGREVPDVPVSALSPERKKAFDKSEYYSRVAEKESVDFVKTRYEEKAAYWNKVFRGEAVTPDEKSRFGSRHAKDPVDAYINVRHCIEKSKDPEETKKFRVMLGNIEQCIRDPSILGLRSVSDDEGWDR